MGREIIPLSSEDRAETPREETVEELPPPRTVPIPEGDVPGADLEGLARYPGAVRIEYIRERQEDVIWTEIEYLTDASMSEAREYYRNAFRESGWNVNDIGFAQNSWVFFIVQDDREVFVELKPRGSGVEIDLEQTEPVPAAQNQPVVPQQQPAPPTVIPDEDYDDDYDDIQEDYEDDLDDDYDDDFDDDDGDYDD